MTGCALAQPKVGLDLGTAVPTGNLATFRSPGFALAASLGTRKAGISPRAELAVAYLVEDEGLPSDVLAVSGSNSGRGDYTSVGARFSMMLRGRGRGVKPYALVGGGLYAISIADDRNPYGDLFGSLHLGLGLEVPLGVTEVALEVGAVAMATDYGAGPFNFPTVHIPATVGVRF